MDLESEDPSKTPLSSPPSTEEPSMCPDYISSYTQISQFNHQNDETVADHTDIESGSDDEFENDDDQKSPSDLNEDLKKKDPNALPELSSQIIEWSKKAFESYNKDSSNEEPSSSESPEPIIDSGEKDDRSEGKKLKFFQMKFISDIETRAMMIAENLNQIMTYINSYSTNITTTSLDVMEIYRDDVFDACDHIDADIKLMYKIISKCEELNKSLGFLDELRNRIKDIKQTLDTFERIVISKKLATTTVKDNELIPLQHQQESSNSRAMYSPPPPTSSFSSPEGQSSTPKIDVASTTSVPPAAQPSTGNPNAERVYVWDCYRSFCVSNNRLMNRIITWAIIFFNVLLFMMSGTILGIGIWLIADPKSYEPSRFLDTYNVIWAAYIMIIISSFTLALSIFGILAVRWENIYMIILYLIFLLICFGMQVAIVTLAIMRGYGTRLYIFAYKELLRELQQYNYQADSRAFIDFFQIKLRCCGVESFNDYPRYGMAIPISCYMAGKTYLNEQGCALALRRHYELRTAVVGFLCFFNGWIHLIIAILIFFLLFCRKY